MNTLAKLLRLPRLTESEIGIEIEMEGLSLPTSRSLQDSNWKVDSDGSLKGQENAEYLLRSPIMMKEVKKELGVLKTALQKSKAVVADTYRAGIHAHINVQDITPKQLMTYATCYFIVEEMLVNWCNPSRRGNHFCLRASDAEYTIYAMVEAIKKNNLKLLHTDQLRYSGLNIKSIFVHGSLEFRALESTTDFDKVHDWCEILLNLKKVSLTYESPDQVMQDISMGGYEAFLRKMFRQHLPKIMCPEYEAMIRRGVYTCQDIAYAKNWGAKNLNIFLQSQGEF